MKNDDVPHLEMKISHLLRWGVLLSGALLLIGWMSFMDFSQNPLAAFHEYKEETLAQSLQHAWQKESWGLLVAYAGLMLLISLPLLRVLVTGILFLKQKEKLLASLAFVVFGILIFSFYLGIEV